MAAFIWPAGRIVRQSVNQVDGSADLRVGSLSSRSRADPAKQRQRRWSMVSVTRRTLLKSAGASLLPLPAIAQGSRAQTLKFVPQSNLSILDPTFTTGGITNAHAYAVFDMLYGLDSKHRPKPQMAEGHTVSDDGLTWLI